MKHIAIALLILCHGIAAMADSLDSLVQANHLKATIVVTSLKSTRQYTYNEFRANQQFLPASTFKIPNTLIALQEKAISGLHDTIRWDGTERFLESWNHDQDLGSAFQISCVWFYQELAARVGQEAYRIYLKKMDYGNGLTGPDVATFWLDGDIRISAHQQISFLRKLYKRELPFDQRNYDLLRRVMLTDSTTTYKMYAKTGWAARADIQTGWYVGFVETTDDVWFFACNLEIRNEEETVFRKELVYRYLRDLKIIPEAN